MNRIFSIIWSKARHAWVVVSELANRGDKSGVIDKRIVVRSTIDAGAVDDSPPAMLRPLRAGILLALLAPCAPARAVDYYWDIDGATAGAGGGTPSGTWDAGGTTLSTDSTGATATGAVTTTTADRLFFSAGTDATGSYTVTVNGTQNIGRLTFQEGTANLSGGTINFGAVNGIIDGAAPADANSISSVIAGTGGLRFSNGTFTLNGAAANTYTGTTQVGGSGLNQASLVLSSAGGNAISGSVLQLGGGNYTSAGFVTLGAADQINDTATVNLISGHYSGSSVFSLNGFNETIGGLNLHHQGNASAVIFRNGAATDATLTLAGSGTYSTGGGDRLGGRAIQNGAAGRLHVVVALTGSGMQTFAGLDPSYTGTTTVSSGTLRLWNTSAWASNTVLNGGTLTLHQTSIGTSTVAGAATRTHSQTIDGTGGTLRKTGNGTVILSGNNTYQGATAIDEGTLRAGSATAFGNNSAVTFANVAGATLDLNNFNISVGSLAGGGTTGGNVTLGAGNLTTGGNNTSTSYGGGVSGTGTLVKIGTGTQTLTGANAYSGNTTVNAGTLQLGGGGTSGSISSAQATVAAAASLAVNRSDAFTLSQNVTGDGTLVQRGTGTTTMATNSDIDHVVLEHGRLATPGTLLTDDITFTNDGGATLQVSGTVQTAAAGATLVTGGTANDTVQIDAGATLLVNGGLGDGADTLDVAGTLNIGAGSFDLGAGDDTFVMRSTMSIAGAIDGGAGTDAINANGLSFTVGGGLQLNNWETLNLLNGSRLSHVANLTVGTLNIDSTSTWSPDNFVLNGNVSNAGRIEVGSNSPTINGNYSSAGDAGVIAINVAPASGTAGVLQISGDVQGFSTIDFNGDGSVASTANPILVISSPNDNLGTAGGFLPKVVRLSGNLEPFLLGQQVDNNWYLTPTGVENLSEIPGYSGGGALGAMTAGYMQKMAEDRSKHLRECFIHGQSAPQGEAAGNCSRSWVHLPRNRIDIEGNPGFAMNGDLNSLYLGTDNLEMTGDYSAFMVGAYLLYQQGKFDTGSGNFAATLNTTTRAIGLYGGLLSSDGSYLDINGSFSATESRVQTQDGFNQSLHGTMFSLGVRAGHLFQLSPDWRLDPHVGLSVTSQRWNRIVDAADRRVDLKPDTWTVAQAGARLTRQSGDSQLWASLSAAKTLDGGETQLTLSTDTDSRTFDGHRFDSSGKTAIGISGALSERVEISGEVSATRSISGTEYKESEIYLEMRFVW